MERTRYRLIMMTTLGSIAALLVLMLHLAISEEDGVRLRTGLLASVGAGMAEFAWTPQAVPVDYKLERGPIPSEFQEIAHTVMSPLPSTAGNLDRALALAAHLVRLRQQGEPVQADTLQTYRRIVDEGRGYCADFTQVFNGLALSAGIPVREWGLAFDGFGAGHAFNEIYDPRLGKWILIDSFNSFYAVDAATGVPLSVLEFRDRLLSGQAAESLRLVPIAPGRFGFKNPAAALEYYGRGADQFYLWWGNNVFSYDAHPVVSLLRPVSRVLEEAGGIVSGVYPAIRIVPSASNGPMVAKLFSVRDRFYLYSLLVAGLAVLFAGQIWHYRRISRRPFRRLADVIRG